MVKVVTCVYDTVAGIYGNPAFDVNVQVSKRNFEYACKNVPGLPCADLQLVYVADFDDKLGVFNPKDHEVLAHGKEYIINESV